MMKQISFLPVLLALSASSFAQAGDCKAVDVKAMTEYNRSLKSSLDIYKGEVRQLVFNKETAREDEVEV